MKISSILICFCVEAITTAKNIETFQQTPVSRDINTDAIVSQIFEVVKWMIKNGSPDVFPVLDPMNLFNQTFHMSLPNKMFTISANFTNVILKGLGDFEMLQVKFYKSEIALYFSVNFPLMTLTAEEYEMVGDIYDAIPLTGNGTFEFQMKNLNFSSKVYIKQSENGESAIIDKFEDTQYSIDKITSYTEFDKNIDDIFGALVEDLLADYLTRVSNFIIMTYTDTALEILNPFLYQFESWKFIDAILQHSK